MRHNLLTKILVLVLALLVLIPNMGLGVFAADDGGSTPTTEGGSDTPTESFDVSGSKKASPNLLIGEDRETTVTLSLPSAEYKNEIDIVFAMDSSSSAQNSSVFAESVNSLFDSILENNPSITLKIGVVLFRGYASDAIEYFSDSTYKGLVVYNDETKAYINNALNIWEYFRNKFGITRTVAEIIAAGKNDPDYKKIDNAIKADFGNGSNGHSGLVMAEQMLSADSEVDNDHKYVVFLTDGKNYIWNNAENKPVTIYQQDVVSGTAQGSGASQGAPRLNQYNGIKQKENGAYPSIYNSIPQITDHQTLIFSAGLDINLYDSTYYTNLYNSKHTDLTGVTKYDAPAYYTSYYPADSYNGSTTTGNGTVIQHQIANATSDIVPSPAFYKTYYEYTPQEGTFWDNISYLQINPYKVTQNPDDKKWYYDTDEVNEDFFLWHATSMEKGLYIVGHYWNETIAAKYNTGAIVYYDPGSGGGSHITQSFDQWLVENSKFGAWISNSAQVEALFEDIDNDIRYMVSKGVVTDVIKDNFDLKNPDAASAFRMTFNGEDLTAVFADGIWSFDDGNYTVSYDADSKTITWTINIPIENLKPVTLSYDLLLTEESAKTSKIYDTNDSAVLDYKSTDGKKDGTFTFEVPKVAYIKLIDINVEKQWVDYDNKDGSRPQEVTVQLIELIDDEEELVDEGVLNEKTWKYTFEDVLDATAVFENDEPVEIIPIVYTVKEPAVEGYTPAISGSVEKGFVITNTHEPEFLLFIAKIWDDEQDADGIRPESVTVNLLANGEPIDEAELGDFNMWTASYTVPFYDADGEPIEYTVTEEPVEGYEKPVIVFDPEYSVYLVTNKHEVKEPPKTDDATNQWFWAGMMVSSMALIAVIFYLKRKQDEE